MAAGASLLPAGLVQFAHAVDHESIRRFPKGFVWGCATASYQIEGGVKEDGRGETNWDVFSHTPGKIHDNDTGDVADDSYHLYKDDVRLLKNLGVGGYRFSLAWARIFPTGKGQVNQKGVDYYDRLIDELLKNGIEPYLTLFHWDLPTGLAGGWQSRDTAKAYGDYAAFVAKHFSDRVQHFMTINEFVCFTDLGYVVGQMAPGMKLSQSEIYPIRHHGILAHGLGVQAIRANGNAKTKVGLAENPNVFVPVIETDEHIEAAKKATRIGNAPFLTALMEGKYIDEYQHLMGAAAPKVEEGDFKAISSKLDFVGLNVYTPTYVRADSSPLGYTVENFQTNYPNMSSPWLRIGPETAYWAVRNVCDNWKMPNLYITENGCSADDVLTPAGRIEDTDRMMYLRNYLVNFHRAIVEGYPLKGYFLWSLMDNFEWADGYSKRFGLHYVDYKTMKRTPKLSAEWYKQVIAHNAVE
jgi:beta-glucosidase